MSYTESRKLSIRRDIISVERKIQKFIELNNQIRSIIQIVQNPLETLKMEKKLIQNEKVLYDLYLKLYSLKDRLQLLNENHQIAELLQCAIDNFSISSIYPTRIINF